MDSWIMNQWWMEGWMALSWPAFPSGSWSWSSHLWRSGLPGRSQTNRETTSETILTLTMSRGLGVLQMQDLRGTDLDFQVDQDVYWRRSDGVHVVTSEEVADEAVKDVYWDKPPSGHWSGATTRCRCHPCPGTIGPRAVGPASADHRVRWSPEMEDLPSSSDPRPPSLHQAHRAEGRLGHRLQCRAVRGTPTKTGPLGGHFLRVGRRPGPAPLLRHVFRSTGRLGSLQKEPRFSSTHSHAPGAAVTHTPDTQRRRTSKLRSASV